MVAAWLTTFMLALYRATDPLLRHRTMPMTDRDDARDAVLEALSEGWTIGPPTPHLRGGRGLTRAEFEGVVRRFR